ncbi:MAG TPA: LysE family translocator [Rhizobiaceae bacterium]|nr:LysE family translocator [Rhizobiaceae bacterium]
MHEYLPQILAALSIQTVGVLSPGPSVALILGVAMGRGRFPALMTALGVACGSIVLATATVFGVTALFAQVAEMMTLIRLVGAGYLIWLAWKAFGKAMNPPQINATPVEAGSILRTGLSGFLLQVSNPKAILFWLAIASIGGVGSAPPDVAALFITGAFLNSFAGHGAYALLLSAAPVRHAFGRARRWIEGALGVFFLIAGLRLAMAGK